MSGHEKYELWWRDHREWLESFGYKLRRKLIPQDLPNNANERLKNIEDPQMIIDATRIVDGKRVLLKKVGQEELEFTVFFKYSHDAITKDPRNHCIPIFDVIELPNEEGQAIVVTPFLRPFYTPRFETHGELLEFFRQIFEGLHFMHLYNVAHRGCNLHSILMESDGMYPEGFHPLWPDSTLDFKGTAKQRFTRTRKRPKYYLTGFEWSAYFPPSEMSPLVWTNFGGNGNLPEDRGGGDEGPAFNPFPADVFCLGDTIRSFLLEENDNHGLIRGFQSLEPLIERMMHKEPSQRPTMEEVMNDFDDLLKSQSGWFLRSRIVYGGDKPLSFPRRILYWTRQISYIARRFSALPAPK